MVANGTVTSKPWFLSESVWGAVGAIATSAFAAYSAYKLGNIELAMTSVGAAFTALIALIGRVKATSTLTIY